MKNQKSFAGQLVLKFISAARAARPFAQAQEMIFSRDYDGALSSMKKVARILNVRVGSEGVPLRGNVITLQASYWLYNEDLAIQSAISSSQQILRLVEQRPSADVFYTAHYLFGMCEFCAGRFSDSSSKFLKIALDLQGFPDKYQISQVSTRLLKEMPLGARSLD